MQELDVIIVHHLKVIAKSESSISWSKMRSTLCTSYMQQRWYISWMNEFTTITINMHDVGIIMAWSWRSSETIPETKVASMECNSSVGSGRLMMTLIAAHNL